MSTIDSSTNTKKYIAGGLVGAFVNYSAKKELKSFYGKIFCQNHFAIIHNVSDEEFQKIENIIPKVVNSDTFGPKLLKLYRVSKKNVAQVTDMFYGKKETFIKKIFHRYYWRKASKKAHMIANGLQATYRPKANVIFLPAKKFNLAFFHEAGHALNANFGTMWNLVRKSRCLQKLVIPIAIISLFTNKKNDGKKPDGIIGKTTAFIKNNAGKLTFAAFVPTLLEEGRASLRGNKLAKPLVDAKIYETIVKHNRLAFSTYLATALFSGLSLYLGVKVRDAIVHLHSK